MRTPLLGKGPTAQALQSRRACVVYRCLVRAKWHARTHACASVCACMLTYMYACICMFALAYISAVNSLSLSRATSCGSVFEKAWMVWAAVMRCQYSLSRPRGWSRAQQRQPHVPHDPRTWGRCASSSATPWQRTWRALHAHPHPSQRASAPVGGHEPAAHPRWADGCSARACAAMTAALIGCVPPMNATYPLTLTSTLAFHYQHLRHQEQEQQQQQQEQKQQCQHGK